MPQDQQGENCSARSDDSYKDRELARAAAAYLGHYIARSWLINDELGLLNGADGLQQYQGEPPPDMRPEEWHEDYWKPKDKLRDLVRAGALIAAEIDRLQRLEAAKTQAA